MAGFVLWGFEKVSSGPVGWPGFPVNCEKSLGLAGTSPAASPSAAVAGTTQGRYESSALLQAATL